MIHLTIKSYAFSIGIQLPPILPASPHSIRPSNLCLSGLTRNTSNLEKFNQDEAFDSSNSNARIKAQKNLVKNYDPGILFKQSLGDGFLTYYACLGQPYKPDPSLTLKRTTQLFNTFQADFSTFAYEGETFDLAKKPPFSSNMKLIATHDHSLKFFMIPFVANVAKKICHIMLDLHADMHYFGLDNQGDIVTSSESENPHGAHVSKVLEESLKQFNQNYQHRLYNTVDIDPGAEELIASWLLYKNLSEVGLGVQTIKPFEEACLQHGLDYVPDTFDELLNVLDLKKAKSNIDVCQKQAFSKNLMLFYWVSRCFSSLNYHVLYLQDWCFDGFKHKVCVDHATTSASQAQLNVMQPLFDCWLDIIKTAKKDGFLFTQSYYQIDDLTEFFLNTEASSVDEFALSKLFNVMVLYHQLFAFAQSGINGCGESLDTIEAIKEAIRNQVLEDLSQQPQNSEAWGNLKDLELFFKEFDELVHLSRADLQKKSNLQIQYGRFLRAIRMYFIDFIDKTSIPKYF